MVVMLRSFRPTRTHSEFIRSSRAFAAQMEKQWFTKDRPYRNLRGKTMSLIGAPLQSGVYMAGVEKTPQALRDGGLGRVVRELGWNFRDIGDLDLAGAMSEFEGESSMINVQHCEKIGFANHIVYDAVRQEASAGNFVLTVGGDHGISSATISAMKSVHEDLCVIWVDAQADCHTAATSPTGQYYGMAAAHVMNWMKPSLPGFEWMRPEHMLDESRLAYVALREMDRIERNSLKESGVSVFTMHDIDKFGIGRVMEMALHKVNPHSDRPIHLSFDIDGCDPSEAPGTGTCIRGGLNFREAHYVCEKLSMTSNLVSMDLVEINPDSDVQVQGRMHGDHASITADKVTVRLGIELIGSALGRTIL